MKFHFDFRDLLGDLLHKETKIFVHDLGYFAEISQKSFGSILGGHFPFVFLIVPTFFYGKLIDIFPPRGGRGYHKAFLRTFYPKSWTPEFQSLSTHELVTVIFAYILTLMGF
ncbi:unnamed protein product [Meganyctiphanes norvegica]|uniref:Uncharacterized protein n=1 Tax=Meganyctiphanes norvegica TaxID=48144 RepID=A0AAV2RKZ6_MEGNR